MGLITTPAINSVFATGNSKLSGPVTFTGGSNCTITPSGQVFTIAFTGSSSSTLRSFCRKALLATRPLEQTYLLSHLQVERVTGLKPFLLQALPVVHQTLNVQWRQIHRLISPRLERIILCHQVLLVWVLRRLPLIPLAEKQRLLSQ
jgi:hypothetical protein